MSHYVTQAGLEVTCLDPTCICNAAPRPNAAMTIPGWKDVTPAAVAATEEERWFDELCDAIEFYLTKYAAHYEAPKSEREWREVEVHEAKRAVVDRFYAKGWDAR